MCSLPLLEKQCCYYWKLCFPLKPSEDRRALRLLGVGSACISMLTFLRGRGAGSDCLLLKLFYEGLDSRAVH